MKKVRIVDVHPDDAYSSAFHENISSLYNTIRNSLFYMRQSFGETPGPEWVCGTFVSCSDATERFTFYGVKVEVLFDDGQEEEYGF